MAVYVGTVVLVGGAFESDTSSSPVATRGRRGHNGEVNGRRFRRRYLNHAMMRLDVWSWIAATNALD